MTDLNMFRAMQQSRAIIEEEFTPRVPPRLASEVVGAIKNHSTLIVKLPSHLLKRPEYDFSRDQDAIGNQGR